MKTKVSLLLFIFIATLVKAQDFDAELESLAQALAVKINTEEKSKVAIWGFFSDNEAHTEFGDYLTEDFSIHLTNYAENFAVVDRMHLNIILKEHRLNFKGYIDEKTTKRLGKISAADVVIVGTYTIFDSEIKIRAKALDTETALQFAGTIGTLSMDENIAKLLGKL